MNVRKYNNRTSNFNGCWYISMSDAKSRYNNSPKRAAALAISTKVDVSSSNVYNNLVRTVLNNGEKVYFYSPSK